MGKYRATINMGGHRRGEVKEYDDTDPVLGRRLKAGTVVPVLGGNPLPVVETSVNPEPEVEGSDAGLDPVDNSVDNSEGPEAKPAPAKKRAPAKKKSEPVVEDPAPVGEPVEEQSSVQTSWYISPSQSEG